MKVGTLISYEKLAIDLCAILGLESSLVAGISINMKPAQPVKVVVEIVPTMELLVPIRDALADHADELREGLERTSA